MRPGDVCEGRGCALTFGFRVDTTASQKKKDTRTFRCTTEIDNDGYDANDRQTDRQAHTETNTEQRIDPLPKE